MVFHHLLEVSIQRSVFRIMLLDEPKKCCYYLKISQQNRSCVSYEKKNIKSGSLFLMFGIFSVPDINVRLQFIENTII